MCPSDGVGPYGLQTECACDDAWTGPLCDWCCAVPNATACVHVNASDGPLSCKGGAGTCAPKFYGPLCKKFCDPVTTCSSAKATCSATGECVCGADEAWDYDRAACVSCPVAPVGVCPVTDEVCCGRSQECANGPSCICQPQYTGQFCETQCCPSDAHGFCDSGGNCLCDVDADDVSMFVSNCTIPCPLDDNNLVCGGHGLCTLNGSAAVCNCADGWFGPACSCQSTTCHGHGRCSLAQTGAACECYAPWDSSTDCSSCLPGFYGTECSVLCFDNTCKRGSFCSAFGCAKCEEGFDPSVHVNAVDSATLRGVFRGVQYVNMSCGERAAQAAILQANGTTLAQISCEGHSDRALVNFGDILVDAPVNLDVQFVTVSGCDRCYPNFYPNPAVTSDLQPCTTFCDKRLCSFSGECNESTGLCHCTKPHVKQTQNRLNRLFCSQCEDGWGPPPQNGPTCNVYCNATAKNYAECMRSDAMNNTEIACDASKMCANNERCTYNFTAPYTGNVTCVDTSGVTRLCSVPTSNANVDSVNMPCYAVRPRPVTDCNFCSGNGDCLSGTCNCGQRRSDAPSLRKQNERIDAYHGLHCQLTCTQPGSTNVCSGHGVCLQPDADKPPYCVCDGGGSVTPQQWEERNAQCPGGDLNCSAAGAPPQPVYFGLYCEKHAPLFYYESDGLQTSICQGNSFEQLTTYALVNLTSQQQTWVQNQSCSVAEGAGLSGCCGLSREEDDVVACDLRSDVYCNNATNLCTKLECQCPPDIGGDNCGAYCKSSQMNNCVKVVNKQKQLEQNCVASACGALVPQAPEGVIVVSPCSRGACVAVPNGSSAEHPAPSFAPVAGKCMCNTDAPSTDANNSDCFLYDDMISQRASKTRQNQSQYAETCCGKGHHLYGGGGLPNASFCGQDCECNSIAIANGFGKCTNPFSSICTCSNNHCGHDCMGKCSDSCAQHGSCFTTGYKQCGCDCNGGFIQKTAFGVTKAPLYVGLQCTVDCFDPKSDFLQVTPPAFDSTRAEQDAYLKMYLGNLTRCSGNGICALDAITGLPGCLCNAETSGKNCNNSCYVSTAPYHGNEATAQLAFELNGYRDCPLGHCLVDNPNSQKPDYECVRDTNIGRTTAAPQNVNTTCAEACLAANTSDYMYNKCLCFLQEGSSLPCGPIQCPENPQQLITVYPSNKFQEYMLGSLQAGNDCRVCRDTKSVPTADCAPGFLSSGNAYKFVRGQNAGFGQCRQDNCPFADIHTSVTVAVRFAINRDCTVNYFDGPLGCSQMSVAIDDYYVAEHLESGPKCVCDTAHFYVDNVEADRLTKCLKCSLLAAGSDTRAETARCTCEAGSYFLPPGNCSMHVPSDNSWCCLNMIPSCECTKAPQAALRWLSASIQNSARFANHTFCNSDLDVPCNPNGVAINSAVFPSTYTYSNILNDVGDVKTRTLVGQFACKDLLTTDGGQAYYAQSVEDNWLFGFNCVRMLRPVSGLQSRNFIVQNVTNDPVSIGAYDDLCSEIEPDASTEGELCPFVLYSAQLLPNCTSAFGLYNQWTLLFDNAARGYSSLTQNMCQRAEFASTQNDFPSFYYCQPREGTITESSFNRYYVVNAGAAAFIPGAAYGVARGQMPRINFTLPAPPVVPRAQAQCYNLNMYLPMQGSGDLVSPLCSYLLLYGGLSVDSYKQKNVTEFCNKLFLNAQNLVQLQNVPGLLTGDSCRDMLLTEDAASTIAKYDGNRLLNILDLHGKSNNLFGRIHGVFGENDPVTAMLDNPFIIDAAVANAYWCNPATLRCEFGRNHSVEASLDATRFQSIDTVQTMLDAGALAETALTSMGCYNISCTTDDCSDIANLNIARTSTLEDIYSSLTSLSSTASQLLCKLEDGILINIQEQYPIQWQYDEIVNQTAFEAYELVVKGSNIGTLDSSVVQLQDLQWSINPATLSQMCASQQPSPYLCAFFTPIVPDIPQTNNVYRFKFDSNVVELLTCGGLSSSVPCICPGSLDAHARCQEVVLPQDINASISCETPGLVPMETQQCYAPIIPLVANAA